MYMSLLQSTFGQFACAMKGGHKVSNSDEERLYSSETEQLDTVCSRCDIPIHLKIDATRKEIYSIRVSYE
jgi:hypothetical protein